MRLGPLPADSRIPVPRQCAAFSLEEEVKRTLWLSARRKPSSRIGAKISVSSVDP